MSGQWQSNDLTCERCHQKKADVHERVNPYEEDVNNDPSVMHTVCDDCNREVADDI